MTYPGNAAVGSRVLWPFLSLNILEASDWFLLIYLKLSTRALTQLPHTCTNEGSAPSEDSDLIIVPF